MSDRDYDGANEFVAALITIELPEQFNPKPIWPNKWGQDVAMAAFYVHGLRQDNERLERIIDTLCGQVADLKLQLGKP